MILKRYDSLWRLLFKNEVILLNNVVFSTGIDRYAFFEKKSPSNYTRRCIDNSIIGSNKCVGYCQYDGHPGFLTKSLLKKHNCIEKECYHFVKKSGKDKPLNDNYDISSLIMAHAQNFFSNNEAIKIMSVKNTEYKDYTISYITITNECNFNDYISIALNVFDANVSFVRLNYDFETCAALILAN